jgi:hypothetical protein
MSLERMPPDLLLWLQERVIERDGCWIWQRTANRGDGPRAHINGQTISVRRYLFNQTHMAQLGPTRCAVTTCDSPLCVHPDHITSTGRAMVQKGRPQRPTHTANIVKALTVNAKVSPEDLHEIRGSDEPLTVLADRYGVHPSYIGYIKRGERRKDYASPWAQLMGSRA